MEAELFRREVLERRGERLWGELMLGQPLALRWLVLALALLAAVLLLFLGLGSYTRKVTVQGRLVPDQGLITVAAAQRGLLQELLVAPGDEVQEGQPLFRLQLDHTLVDEGGLTRSLAASLQQQHARVQEQLELQQAALARIEADGRQQAALLHSSIQRLQEMLQREQELEQIRQQALQRAGLLQGLHPHRFEIGPCKLPVLQQQAQARQELEVQLLQQQTRLGESDSQQQTALLQGRQQLQRLQAELEELAQRRLRLAAEQDTLQRAPLAGRVSAVHLQPGMPVALDQPVLSLLPAASRLRAELLLPGSAIGFVAPGQQVQLRLEAFPYQKFGMQQAWLEQLMQSPEPLPPGEAALPLYRALARLEQQSVQAFGRQQPLLAGMPFSADVALDERSLLEWLLEPLFSIRGRQ